MRSSILTSIVDAIGRRLPQGMEQRLAGAVGGKCRDKGLMQTELEPTGADTRNEQAHERAQRAESR
jgi:hypothetical protein